MQRVSGLSEQSDIRVGDRLVAIETYDTSSLSAKQSQRLSLCTTTISLYLRKKMKPRPSPSSSDQDRETENDRDRAAQRESERETETERQRENAPLVLGDDLDRFKLPVADSLSLYGPGKKFPEAQTAGRLPSVLMTERQRLRQQRQSFLFSVRYRSGPLGIGKTDYICICICKYSYL